MSRRNPTPRKKRPSTITVPDHVGPHVRLVFEEMRRQGQTYFEIEGKSGVQKPTLKAWRHRCLPNLANIEAVLGALGFEFVPIPTSRAIPPEILDALRPIAERLDLTMPAAIRLAAEVAYRDRRPPA